MLTVDLNCNHAIHQQVDAIMMVFNAVSDACEKQNDDLAAQGFSHCATLCTDKAIKTLEGMSVEISYQVGTSSGGMMSGSIYGSGGMGYPSGSISLLAPETNSTPAPAPASASTYPARWQIQIKLKIPLTPTTQVQCTNPFNSPVVTGFANTFLTSPWAQKKFQESCSGTSFQP